VVNTCTGLGIIKFGSVDSTEIPPVIGTERSPTDGS